MAENQHRIAKLLARAGIASRREIERMIVEGRVALHGTAIDTPATLLASLDGVTVDGQPVAAAEPARLFVYHKPTGLLVTERDPKGRPTIYDRLPAGLPRLVPVGRLDLNTEGLLLLTTDGGLKRQLELPASGVIRTYRARVYGAIGQAQLEELIDGIEVDGIRYGSIDANLERRTGANAWIELSLAEGKNREVRRVLQHLGLDVGRLIRTRYGPFVLADLPSGAIGEVRSADLDAFRDALARGKPNIDRAIMVATTALPSKSSPTRGGGPSAGRRRGGTASASTEDGKEREPQTSRRAISTSATRPFHPDASRRGPPPRGGEDSETKPARPKRKAGWAKPKPRVRPGKPRR